MRYHTVGKKWKNKWRKTKFLKLKKIFFGAKRYIEKAFFYKKSIFTLESQLYILKVIILKYESI